jgi:PhnB protein
MKPVNFNPYVFFDGSCREAMEFYKSIFGGKLAILNWETNPNVQDAGMKGKVMHARLETDDGFVWMAADSPTALAKEGNRISLALGGMDEDKLRQWFDALGAEGIVKSPLKTESWGDTFGMLTDKFGVDWMVNISSSKEESAA